MMIPEIIGILFVIVIGTLMHFAFKTFGENRIIGIFTPVNESTWEHLKLLFFPMLFYTILEYFAFGKYINNFLGAKSIGIILGMLAIVVLFYTYTGILGRNYLWADILTFIIGVIIAFVSSWKILINGTHLSNLPVIMILLLALCFAVFTFYPPKVALFLDPVTKRYGLSEAGQRT